VRAGVMVLNFVVGAILSGPSRMALSSVKMACSFCFRRYAQELPCSNAETIAVAAALHAHDVLLPTCQL